MNRSEIIETKRENRKAHVKRQATEFAIVVLVILPTIMYYFQDAIKSGL